MDQDQTAVWSGVIVFTSMMKSSQKCTWIYAADDIFRTNNIGGIRTYKTNQKKLDIELDIFNFGFR